MRSYNYTTTSCLDEARASHAVQSNPDYKTRVALGIPLMDLPYSLDLCQSQATTQRSYVQYYEYGEPTALRSSGSTTTYVINTFTGYQMVKSGLESKMQDFLDHKSNRLLSKIKAQSLPLLMMYRERHRTGELVLGFLQKATDFAKHARRRDWKRALRVYGIGSSTRPARRYMSRIRKWEDRTNTVGAAWLQARFAWLPLYHDIKDSLNSAAEYEKKIHTFRNRVGDSFSGSAYYREGDAQNSWEGTREGHFSMVINYAISDETLAAVGSMMDVPTTMWDAVPYSFVIDRVVDISNYLDLHNATLGASFTSGSSTLFYIDKIQMPAPGDTSFYPSQLTYLVARYGRRYFNKGPNPTRTDVRMIRSILSSFPAPKLEYPLRNSYVLGTDIFFLAAQLKRKFSTRL